MSYSATPEVCLSKLNLTITTCRWATSFNKFWEGWYLNIWKLRWVAELCKCSNLLWSLWSLHPPSLPGSQTCIWSAAFIRSTSVIGSSRNPLNFELSLNPLRVLAYFGMVFLHQQFLTSWIGLKRATWWQCQKGYCCASWFRTEVFHCLRSNLWNFPVQHIQEFCKNVGTEVFRTCPLRSKLQKALLWIVTIKITIIISATSKNTPSTQKNTHSKWFSTLCQYIFNSKKDFLN